MQIFSLIIWLAKFLWKPVPSVTSQKTFFGKIRALVRYYFFFSLYLPEKIEDRTKISRVSVYQKCSVFILKSKNMELLQKWQSLNFNYNFSICFHGARNLDELNSKITKLPNTVTLTILNARNFVAYLFWSQIFVFLTQSAQKGFLVLNYTVPDKTCLGRLRLYIGR